MYLNEYSEMINYLCIFTLYLQNHAVKVNANISLNVSQPPFHNHHASVHDVQIRTTMPLCVPTTATVTQPCV